MSTKSSLLYWHTPLLSLHYFHDCAATASYPARELDRGMFLEISWERGRPPLDLLSVRIPAPVARPLRWLRNRRHRAKTFALAFLLSLPLVAVGQAAECGFCPLYDCYGSCGDGCVCLKRGFDPGQCFGEQAVPALLEQGYTPVD